MTYEETIAWLFGQFPAYHLQGTSAYKPSLANSEAMAEQFGNPHLELRFVHIAGTNGKGSTSNMLASILTESKLKTGLFTSPHIHDFRERIRIDGTCIDEQSVIDFCEAVRRRNWDIAPSFFEITWLMALCYFRDQRCDIVVAETGLGGRLDATNIVTPLVSVITNIGLDHTDLLGNTKPAIAGEKAGIIKQGIPVVIGEMDRETAPVFREKASTTGSKMVVAQTCPQYPETVFGYQRRNFDTVMATVEELRLKGFSISTAQVSSGIQHLRRNTGFMGRLEVVGHEPLTIVDCAHNPDGIAQLIASVRERLSGKLHILYGTSSDKDLSAILDKLPNDALYYVTVFSNPRSAQLPELKRAFGFSKKDALFFDHPLEAYSVMKQAASKQDTLLITGSFFLVGDFFPVFFA